MRLVCRATVTPSDVCVTRAGPAHSVTSASVTRTVTATATVTTAPVCVSRAGTADTALSVSGACFIECFINIIK